MDGLYSFPFRSSNGCRYTISRERAEWIAAQLNAAAQLERDLTAAKAELAVMTEKAVSNRSAEWNRAEKAESDLTATKRQLAEAVVELRKAEERENALFDYIHENKNAISGWGMFQSEEKLKRRLEASAHSLPTLTGSGQEGK